MFIKIINLLFRRNTETNDLTQYPNWRIGLSMCASWSWTVGLLVGWAILYVYGIIAFCGWSLGNVLALPLFGYMRTRIPLSRNWPRFTVPMVVLFAFVEVMCIIINLQGLLNACFGKFEQFHQDIPVYQFFPESQLNYVIAAIILIGLVIVWYIRKWGLRASVLTDLFQYAVQLAAVVLMLILGMMYNHTVNFEWIGHDIDGVSGLTWVRFGFFGIIVGAIGTSHQWQRFAAIKEENIFRASCWGGLLFFIYMVFVGLSAIYYFPHPILTVVLMVILLALASSSIDSAVAGIEYVIGRFKLPPYIASIIATIVIVIVWPTKIQTTVTNLWSFMARYRLDIIIFMTISTLALNLFSRNRKLGEVFIKIGRFLSMTGLMLK